MEEVKKKKREKKPLSDHSDICGSGVGPLFKDKQINELRSKFEFEASFPLCEELEQYLCNYLAYRNMPKSTCKEEKRLLDALAKRTGLLLEVLEKLGLQEEYYLDNQFASRPDKMPLRRSELEDQIREWNRSSVKALSELTRRTAKVGRALNTQDMELIQALHAIYQSGTGRNDRLTRISDTPDLSYGGKFFNFVDLLFTAIGCPKRNAQLGKLIEQSLKRTPKTTSR